MSDEFVVYVSHQGFVRCTCCGVHMEVAQKLENTVCPQCEVQLDDEVEVKPSGLSKLIGVGGRSALLAAALLATAPACEQNANKADNRAEAITAKEPAKDNAEEEKKAKELERAEKAKREAKEKAKRELDEKAKGEASKQGLMLANVINDGAKQVAALVKKKRKRKLRPKPAGIDVPRPEYGGSP